MTNREAYAGQAQMYIETKQMRQKSAPARCNWAGSWHMSVGIQLLTHTRGNHMLLGCSGGCSIAQHGRGGCHHNLYSHTLA